MKLNLKNSLLVFIIAFFGCNPDDKKTHENTNHFPVTANGVDKYILQKDNPYKDFRLALTVDSLTIGFRLNHKANGFYSFLNDSVKEQVFYKRVYDDEINDYSTDEIITLSNEGNINLEKSFFISIQRKILYKYYLKKGDSLNLLAHMNFPFQSITYLFINGKDTLSVGNLSEEQEQISIVKINETDSCLLLFRITNSDNTYRTIKKQIFFKR